MVDPNWGLLRPDNGANNALAQGFSLGSALRERQDARDQRNALAAYVTNKSSGNGLVETPEQKAESERIWAHLVRTNPELALRVQQQEGQTQQRRIEQRRADLPLIGRLLDHAKDEATYQQSRAAAQQYGIDVSGLPQNFDPAWIEQQRTIVHAMSDPTKMEALSSAGKAAVDMGYKPGTPEFNKAVNEIWAAGESKPYVVGGETRLYTPKIGGPGQAVGSIPSAAVEALKRGEGTAQQFDEMFGAGAAARILGGQETGGGGGHVTSNFLDGI